ncbi:transposase [Phaeobacter italicus]|uniref:transposase n=1 Tax=Phaeobacter italicus TaxID=481446 RepID=UPI0035117882
MAGKKGQKKRFWSDEEKRSICNQTQVPGVSVAQVARRYSMNSNLIFTWLAGPALCAWTEGGELRTGRWRRFPAGGGFWPNP